MKIQLEKRDGLVHDTNLTILAKALYVALDENDLLHQNADDFMVINTVFDAIEELVGSTDD
jgi:hypothetical protein|tara:strand:+ start:53 stop:235 length:183 start_codon:yes stop_codon:yes gene_type:complete